MRINATHARFDRSKFSHARLLVIFLPQKINTKKMTAPERQRPCKAKIYAGTFGMSCIYSHSIHQVKSHPSWQQFKHQIAPGLLIKLRFSRSLIASSLSMQLRSQSSSLLASFVRLFNSPRLTKPKCRSASPVSWPAGQGFPGEKPGAKFQSGYQNPDPGLVPGLQILQTLQNLQSDNRTGVDLKFMDRRLDDALPMK